MKNPTPPSMATTTPSNRWQSLLGCGGNKAQAFAMSSDSIFSEFLAQARTLLDGGKHDDRRKVVRTALDLQKLLPETSAK